MSHRGTRTQILIRIVGRVVVQVELTIIRVPVRVRQVARRLVDPAVVSDRAPAGTRASIGLLLHPLVEEEAGLRREKTSLLCPGQRWHE
ncbi:MAG: hypothetical protein WC654_06705 [Patescibacteria group bacterium]